MIYNKFKMYKIFVIAVFVLTTLCSSSMSAEQVSFDSPVRCVFQYGQYMDSQKAKTDTQKNELEWVFYDLLGSKPYFYAGGDTGSIEVHKHTTSDGLSVWLKQGNGAHLFSIWPDGTAFWSKHNDLFNKATQQFRGTCTNIRKVE